MNNQAEFRMEVFPDYPSELGAMSKKKQNKYIKKSYAQKEAIEKLIAVKKLKDYAPLSGDNDDVANSKLKTAEEAANEWEADKARRGETGPSEEEIQKEKVENAVKGWPWTGCPDKLVSLAPHTLNNFGHIATRQEAEQSSRLLRFLEKNDDIRKVILGLLFRNHKTAAAFSMTSLKSFRLVASLPRLWDITEGWFDHCENDQKNLGPHEDYLRGSVGNVVMVTPVRLGAPKPAYELQVKNLHKLANALYNFAENFRNLQLHRVPFLTTHLLSLLVPHMRNLEVLGIYKCPLIHVGHTMRLLEIVQTDRMKGSKQVALDFFPNHHVGPIPIAGSGNFSGSYGVSWDNVEIDTRLAIWQIVVRCLPQARKQGVDLESPASAFRQWLDKSPCWRVNDTLELLKRLGDEMRMPTAEEIVAQVDYPSYKGRVSRLKKKLPNRPEGWECKVRHYQCRGCRKHALGIFYDHAQYEQALYERTHVKIRMTCLGCKLTTILNHEEDHYKAYKRIVMEHWLGKEWHKEDDEHEPILLSTALTETALIGVMASARALDKKRARQLKEGYDHEDGEIQRYIKPGKGKLNWQHISPTIDQKDPNQDKWNWYREDRLFANGRY